MRRFNYADSFFVSSAFLGSVALYVVILEVALIACHVLLVQPVWALDACPEFLHMVPELHLMDNVMEVTVLVMAVKFRHYHDGIHLRKELIALGLIVISSSVAVPLLAGRGRILHIFHRVITASILLISVTLPSLAAWRSSRRVARSDSVLPSRTPSPGGTACPSLASVLAQPESDVAKAFTRFLVKEFSVENLMFLHAVANYKQARGGSRMLAMENILKDFVSAQSVNQVNLSSSVCSALLRRSATLSCVVAPSALVSLSGPPRCVSPSASVSVTPVAAPCHLLVSSHGPASQLSAAAARPRTPPADLFDAAQQCILQLVEQDSWKRFLVGMQEQT